MANYSSEFPDHYYEGPYRASGTPAYHRGSANSTFPHMPENLVCGFDNSYCAVMMTSNTRTLSTMSQTSQDSGYNSGFCSPIDSAPDFLHSPTSSPYVETWCDLAFDPVPSHPPLGPSNSSVKAEKSISSSPTSTSTSSISGKLKPYCCMYPKCETSFARPYDLGRHQKTKHANANLANAKRYDCPEETCRRYGIPESRSERGGFTRLDHFRDHVKNLHDKTVIKDNNKDGGQCWVLDPKERDGILWMRDETGSIRTRDPLGHIWVKDAKTGRWRQIS